MVRSRCALIFCAALAAVALAAPAADAKRIAKRTSRVGGGGTGSTLRPTVSDSGRFLVFDSSASSLTHRTNGDRDVFIRDLVGRTTRLVSHTTGPVTDGSSVAPAVSADGKVVAFESDATNLVEGDENLASDVFVEVGGRLFAVSTAGTAFGNGDSGAADLSETGRYIVFQSTATNLVDGDANGVADVFVRDLFTGATRRVSQAADGTGGNGASLAPAISPDGRYVSFASTADNLVPGDTQGEGDVFLADVRTGALRRVSVNSSERAQDRGVRSPFVQISDVGRGGRFVVFDSDATNLAANDRRLHTDIFLRDRATGRTTRVSRALKGEPNSDSVYPRISPNSRFITFESFASNLFAFDASGPDSFLFDRSGRSTILLDVNNLSRTGASHPRQILQRPSVSANGNLTAFATLHPLVSADRNGAADAYVRRTDPPKATIHLKRFRYRLSADDPGVRFFPCRVWKLSLNCPLTGTLAGLQPGRYAFSVRAVGAGMRVGPATVKRFRRP